MGQLGMSVASVKGRKKLNTKASLLTSNSLFEQEDATEPEREIGATLLAFDDPKLCTGCLLLPPRSKKLAPPSAATQLRVVGAVPSTSPKGTQATVSPDGFSAVFMLPDEFEAAIRQA